MSLLVTSGKKIIKAVAVVTAGTFILAGAALGASVKDDSDKRPNHFKAGQTQMQNRPDRTIKEIDPDKAAEKIAQAFNLNKEKITAYQAQGYSIRDLFTAGLFAKAGGKSYDSVIALKTKENNWRDIGKDLNITPEQLRAAQNDLAAAHMSQALNIKQDTIKGLFQNGYKHRDIMTAGVLANRTGKSITDVIYLKKINNTWPEVAASLGVNEEDLKNDMKALFEKSGFGMPERKPHQKGFKPNGKSTEK